MDPEGSIRGWGHFIKEKGQKINICQIFPLTPRAQGLIKGGLEMGGDLNCTSMT